MKKYNCIFLDRDGTLNFDPGYISSLDDFKFFDWRMSSLQKLAQFGNKFCIVSNQSGVARGLVQLSDLELINEFIRKKFINYNIPLIDIYICTDHPNNPSARRKPGIGMFLDAKKDYGLDLANCLMIGDSVIDIESGNSLGMDTMLVLTGNGTQAIKSLSENLTPTYIVKDLKRGADLLCL